MQLDRRLNIVLPIERGSDTLYVHATPISRAIFETYYLVLAKAWSALVGHGLNTAAAPGVALLLLRETAQAMDRWQGANGIEQGLLPEIFRLTNVLMPSPQGYQVVPFEEVRRNKSIDDDDLAEVENILVFFTLASVVPPKRDREGIIVGIAAVWNAQTTSSNSTEYLNSLPTLKETGSSGEKAIPSATIF